MDPTAVCAQADKLQFSGKWREAYEVLKSYADTEEPELLWRLIRSYYRVGKHLARDKAEREEMVRKGEQTVDRTAKKFPEHFQIRNWCGVFISWSSELAGTKERIKQSFVIQEHFQKAIELNGKDATVKHLLGRWCYEVASVGWLTKKLAAALFANPPESSYDEALKYFNSAEETDPGWYTGNWLFLAKTHYQLSNRAEAKKYLTILLEATPSNPEDEEYQEEGRALMRRL